MGKEQDWLKPTDHLSHHLSIGAGVRIKGVNSHVIQTIGSAPHLVP